MGCVCALEPRLVGSLCDRLLGERFNSERPMRRVVLSRLVPLVTFGCDPLAFPPLPRRNSDDATASSYESSATSSPLSASSGSSSSSSSSSSSLSGGAVPLFSSSGTTRTVDGERWHHTFFAVGRFLAMIPATTVRARGQRYVAVASASKGEGRAGSDRRGAATMAAGLRDRPRRRREGRGERRVR